MTRIEFCEKLTAAGINFQSVCGERCGWQDKVNGVQPYFVLSGILADTEADYFAAADVLGVEREEAEKLLASWRECHDASWEGYPIDVCADYEEEDEDGNIVADENHTADGTGHYSLLYI